MSRWGRVALALVIVSGSGTIRPADGIEIDTNTFGGLQARSIGPAVMSGRVAAVDAVPGDTLTIWVGAASGGVWKSDDGGLSFEPVFDEYRQSIGAIRVDPRRPDTVWVGTGESWTRNSVSVGDGIYRTTDGGETWKHLGLDDSERIADIVIDPADSRRVFVCATGHLWGANEQRGVFRTDDGGESWHRVLFVDENTGCADLDIDPQDPAVVYAAMWQFRRYPWSFESGGAGSGLYKSTDGGETWTRLERGLPPGELGRIAVAVAPSRPSVVYANVEAEKSGLFRSTDLGESWERVNSSAAITARPFYFSLVVVDPTDFDHVYRPAFGLNVSTDGGKRFSPTGGGIHPDHHALWINPQNPHQLVLGTDGGLYISHNRGHGWRPVRSLPISQFYRVSYDLLVPYNVYGGLQDNGSWMGPTRSPAGIQNRDWDNVGFGDGFFTFRDPTEPDIVYAEYQGGNIRRRQLSTGEVKDIRPYEELGGPDYRFNWNTPIHLSPGRPGRLYLGAQFLFRSDDRGESWKKISPDLTTDDPAKQRQEESGGLTIDNSTAENHCTIVTISESPRDGNVIWAGTDDGNLQLTRDGGKSWTNVVRNVPGLPANTWVSSVEAGHHAAGTAYATFDGHRTGDMETRVHRTRDYGRTWESLATERLAGYAHVIREDLVNPELLFLGTEAGLFVSLDGGRRWARFEGNLPPVSVRDLAIHPREGDLIIGTHGRGVYILDDLTPIRRLTAEILEADVALLPSRPAVMVIPSGTQSFSGQDEFVGANPPQAAVITYYLKRRHIFGDLRVEIHDAEGTLLRSLPGGKRRGINRVMWPTRLKPPKVPPASSLVPAFQGPRVAEGSYTVKLIKGDRTLTGTVEVVADPRSPHSSRDRAFQQRTSMRLYGLLERMTWMVEQLNDLREVAEQGAAAIGGEDDALQADLRGYADELERFRTSIVASREGGGIYGEERLREKLGGLYGSIVGYEGRPTESQLDRIDVLAQELEQALETFGELRAEGLDGLGPRMERHGLDRFVAPTFEEWRAEQQD